jgi:hypothetical protein
MAFTFYKAIFCTPESWGQRVFCTREQLAEIATELNSVGIDADCSDAEQYCIIGELDRPTPKAWYASSTWETADGQTYWAQHCVMVDASMALLKEGFAKALNTETDERALLMRCLAAA